MTQHDRRPDDHLLHADITSVILGGFYAVHSALGAGFLESVYANALEIELRSAGIQVERELPFKIHYRGHLVGTYKVDMIVAGKVVVETKAARLIDHAHLAQLRNYLRASELQVGLLVNFGPRAEFKRTIETRGADPRLTSAAEPGRPAERSSRERAAPAE